MDALRDPQVLVTLVATVDAAGTERRLIQAQS